MSHLGCFPGRAGAELVRAEPQSHISRLVQGDSLQGTCSTCLSGVSGSRLTVLGRFPARGVRTPRSWLPYQSIRAGLASGPRGASALTLGTQPSGHRGGHLGI